MKNFFYYILLLPATSLMAWTWSVDQTVSFDKPTHATLENLATTFERSTDNLSQSITLVTEKGISSLPLNIDATVWLEIKKIIVMSVLVFLGALMTYWGLGGIRKYLLFTIFQESINTFIKNLLGSITFTLLGFILIILSSTFAHMIILLHA